jgi:hypothetical protein
MKIFVPMPDESAEKLSGHLVPFDPDFLGNNQRVKEGRMPRNWLSANDYSSACERLQLSHRAQVPATA